MMDRFKLLFEKASEIYTKSGSLEGLTENELRVIQDIKAIKDIESFKEFMKKHGI
jgi:hypothetical protein